MKKHWTEELFIDAADLFMVLFDLRPERVTADVDILLPPAGEADLMRTPRLLIIAGRPQKG